MKNSFMKDIVPAVLLVLMTWFFSYFIFKVSPSGWSALLWGAAFGIVFGVLLYLLKQYFAR